MDDIQAISDIFSSVTLSGVLLWAWIQERQERKATQERLEKALQDRIESERVDE